LNGYSGAILGLPAPMSWRVIHAPPRLEGCRRDALLRRCARARPDARAALSLAQAARGGNAMSDPIEQFRAAIVAAGIVPPKIVSPDGKLHRFASNGDARDKAGWYIFHLDGVPAGAFGDFRSDQSSTWRADIDRKLSPQELADCKARVESMRRQREAEDAKVKAEARKEAMEIWDAARPAPDDHPYLAKKGVKPHGLRVHEGRLAVPMLDDQGTLHSLHFIAADGSKRFLTGGVQ
jgi:putative DNA primase/helicase